MKPQQEENSDLSLITLLIDALRLTEKQKCLKKAFQLENGEADNSSIHLRNLGLEVTDLIHFKAFLAALNKSKIVNSFSLSYNPLLCNEGVSLFLDALPESIAEIGIVDCGIDDEIESSLYNLLSRNKNLRMLCMEGNQISSKFNAKLERKASQNGRLTIISK